MPEPDRIDRAARLLERLVADPGFRTRFRRDPAAACREHGLWDLAGELAIGGKAMHTLELRESKSSLAGVIAAVAAEGIALHELIERAGPALRGDAAAAVDRALTLSGLESVKGSLAGDSPLGGAPGGAPAAAATPEGSAGAGSAAPAAAPAVVPAPEPVAPAAEAAGSSEPAPSETPAEPSEAPAEPASASAPAGGAPADAQALLDNPRIDLPAGAQQDLRAGVVDPRIVGILAKLAEDHEIGLSVIKTGHDQFTTSGSVSNHFHGRGIDIATVDGSPVSPASIGAREVAEELAALTGPLRATEIGTPFPIGASGFFTDGAHLDHIHVAFDDEAPANLELPAAGAPAKAVAAAAGPAVGEAGFSPAPPRGPGARQTVEFLRVAGADAGEAGSGFAGGSLEYPGDDASKPELAAWMAAHAQKAGLPPELPVMAALVESGLTNVDHGDADSLGFFQMRESIWNQGEYAGYAEKPELQMKWFTDHALAVKEQQGLKGDDPSTYGNWIADVERPAAEYRDRYQPRYEEAQGLLKAAGEQPAAAAPAAEAAGVEGSSGGASEMVSWVRSKLGTQEGSAAHQRWASELGLSASLPWCSIFVANGLSEFDLPLPANPAYSGAWLDWEGGSKVPLEQIRPGDVVIYDWGDGGITDHVALYVGDDKVIGGNQSNAVTEVPLERGAVVGIVRPDYPGSAAAIAPEAPARASSAAGAVGERDQTAEFQALARQEGWQRNTVQFLKAIDPEQARAAKAGAEAGSGPSAAPDAGALGRDYPGDDASKEEIARWMARHAERVGLPGELPVMAALVESGLTNVDHGDADSLGYFQMRTSIWNTGKYAGYPDQPGLQLKWFLDHALEVKRQRIAAGDAQFGRGSGIWGEWIADVERPAAEYRDRYQPRLKDARVLVG